MRAHERASVHACVRACIQAVSCHTQDPRLAGDCRPPTQRTVGLCIDMCKNMYKSMCIDTCKSMCINVCVDMCIGMCMNICIDIRMDMCVDICIDMCIDTRQRCGCIDTRAGNYMDMGMCIVLTVCWLVLRACCVLAGAEGRAVCYMAGSECK